jgi:hypothetical protein
MTSFLGGQSAGTLMDAVKDYKKVLEKQYGKSMRRKDLRKYREDAADVMKLVTEGDLGKAIKEADKLVKTYSKRAEALLKKSAEVRGEVMKAVAKRLDEIEALIQRDSLKGLKRELIGLSYPLRGTEFEERVKNLQEALKLKEG